MKLGRRGISLLLCFMMVLSLFAGIPVIPTVDLTTEAEAASYTNSGVITAWYTAMTDMNGEKTYDNLISPYFEGNSLASLVVSFESETTFRTSLSVSAGGQTFRMRLTNYYGAEDLVVTKMNVGLAGDGNATSMNTNTIVNITVGGKTSFTIPKGEAVWTDWFTLQSAVDSGESLVFNTYVENSGAVRDAGLTGGNSYAFSGDRTTSSEEGLAAIGHLVYEDEAVGDYNLVPLLNCLEVQTTDTSAYSVMVIGDSTVTNSIPSLIQSKLESKGVYNVAVLGSGIKGNELLQDGAGGDGPLEGEAMVHYDRSTGTYSMGRLDLDALSVTGVKKIFVKIGVNDIIHPSCSNLAEYYNGSSSRPSGFAATADEIIGGYQYIINQAHAKGIEVYFFDITPFQGYTREDTVETTQAMQNIADTVNAWLAANCYDINAAANKDADKMIVEPKGSGTFGYIPVSSLVGEAATNGTSGLQIKSAYTKDNIHFLANAQKVVANAVPLTLFKGVSDIPVDNEATIGNLYVATQDIKKGEYYFIGSSYAVSDIQDSGTSASASSLRSTASDQQDTVVLATDTRTEQSSAPSLKWTNETGLLNYQYPGAYYKCPVITVGTTTTTMQRGTGAAPYIAAKTTTVNSTTVPENTDLQKALWQRSNGEQADVRWQNYATQRYLAYYFPSGKFKLPEYDLGVRTDSPYTAFSDGISSTWYSINTTAASSDYQSRLYFAGVLGTSDDKVLTFSNGVYPGSNSRYYNDWKENATQGFLLRLYGTDNYGTSHNSDVTLYALAEVTTNISTVDAYKDQVFYAAANGTVVDLQVNLDDNLNSTSHNNGKLNRTTLSYTNWAGYGSFVGYTYGQGRTISAATSDNESVCYWNGSNFVLTGNAGTANVSITFKWTELDGTEYDMVATGTVTNVLYTADINIDGAYPSTYAMDSFSGSTSKEISVDYTSVPLYELPAGGSWVWSSSNSSVVSVAVGETDSSKAFIYGTTTDGSAVITASYVANGKTYCSDSITVTNTTAGIDIQIGSDTTSEGLYPDAKTIVGAGSGDTVKLTAQAIGAGAGSFPMTGTYKWEIIGTSTATIADTTARTATVTLAGTTQSVPVKLTYTVNGKTYTSEVTIYAKVGVDLTTTTVIDYGLPVNTGITAAGVSADAPSVALITGKTTDNEFETSANTTYGTASAASGTVVYTPTAIAAGTDTIYYSVEFDTGYKYSDIKIVPATSVYYEDTIGIEYINGKVNGSTVTSGVGAWTTDPGETGTGTLYQSLFNSVYGYDEAYNSCTTYSMGSAHKVTVSASNNPDTEYSGTENPGAWPTASFTFTGTGFDVISRTGSDCGTVTVNVKGTDYNNSYIVDTYHGYTMTQNTEKPYIMYTWEYLGDGWGWHVKHIENADTDNYGVYVTAATKKSYEDQTTMPANPEVGATFVSFESNVTWTKTDNGVNYQIPVIKLTGLTYGTYTVTITPTYISAFDHTNADNDNDNSYSFYLDAIRIYSASSDQGLQVYKDNNEAYPQYINLRKVLINTTTYSGIDESGVKGVALIDGKTENVTVEDYGKYGPNNEIYLRPEQAITFKLVTTGGEPASVQLGLKALSGTANVKVDGLSKAITTSSKTDMYYDITSAYNAKDGVITISNASTTDTVSLTNLKVTFAEDDTTATLMVYKEAVAQAKTFARMAFLAAVPVQEETFEPKILVDAPETVTKGDDVAIKVTTSDDVAYITVNGEKITENDDFVWTYTAKAETAGEKSFVIKAYNADGESVEKSVTVNVNDVFAPEISVDVAATAIVGEDITVNVTTSDNVAYITVNGEKVTEHSSDYVWTVTLKAEKVGKMEIAVVAYNANGEAAENTATATVTVAADAEEEQSALQKLFDAIKRIIKKIFGGN